MQDARDEIKRKIFTRIQPIKNQFEDNLAKRNNIE
jgi:hypothetical protein